MKTLAIFGSTGSIGKTSLEIYDKNKKKFNLLYLSAHRNFNKLKRQYKKYKPKKILLTDNLGNNKKFYKYLIDFDTLLKKKKKIDFVISGFSGYEALKLNLKLLKISRNLLIANKETIICGGSFFLEEAKRNRCKVVPIDSEHYCINYFINFLNKNNIANIKKVYLIASGGPFLNKKINYNQPVNSVLKHPNWKMGKKISVDASNLSNKIMELFEAKILFNSHCKNFDILIEKNSNVHAIIHLSNNVYFPIVHKPSMAIPISNSLNLINQINLNLKNLNIKLIKPNTKKFPIVKLGLKILKMNTHSGMILFTVFNERLVKLYLKGYIKYGDISKNLVKIFKKKNILSLSKLKLKNINEIMQILKKAQNLRIV